MTSIISKNIRYLRKKRNMSQKRLGELTGKTESAIQMWETDKRSPTMGTVKNLSEIFGIDINTLVYTDLETGNKYEEGYTKNFDDITDPEEVAKLFIEHSAIIDYCNYDLKNMSKTDKIELANQILDSIKFFSSKYKK